MTRSLTVRTTARLAAALLTASTATALSLHAQAKAALTTSQPPADAPYKNPKLPIAARVADLLKRMTLDEKVAQVRSMWAVRPRINDTLFNNAAKMDSLFKNGMGMMNPDFDGTMESIIASRNGLQQYLRTKTRLGIPIIYIDEAHHGLLASQVDVFPHGIALSSTWDTTLLHKVYTFVAAQAHSRGTNLVLAPVIDVTRDPRWGRTGETLGEDPYLSGVLGSAIVQGYQGSHDGTIAPNHVAATLKHFSGHAQPEGGDNQAPSDWGPRTLREFHMEPFRICIQRAMPSSIMASYNDLDGVPSHANHWLLTDVLRKEWKYPGLVVSDWFAIDQLWNKHRIEPNAEGAAARAFNAGVTVDLPFGVNYAHLAKLVQDKKVSEAALDSAVAKVLTLKFKLGLFEEAPIDLQAAKQRTGTPEGRELTRQAAEEAMILLKNDNHMLPIKIDQYKKIAVIGFGATTNYLGDYSGIPLQNISLVQGLKDKVGDRVQILTAPGVKLAKNGDTISYNNYQNTPKPILPTAEENRTLIADAVKVAEQADFVIAVVGENELFSREAGSQEHYGDMNTLDLQSDQEELVKALVATKKPVMVYLMHARPLSINWIAANVPAIVDGWFTGEEAGHAFANILFGDVNPSGKLTISVPRTVGQLPVYYNHKPSARFYEYVTGPTSPLFPFGYGLSYTTFTYSKPVLSAPTMRKNGSITLAVNVTNSGQMRGDEIVQLYLRQNVSSATRPVKELKDFARVSLAPGETKTVQFTIDASKLAYWNADMVYGVEPGPFTAMVGPSSADVQKTVFTVLP